MLSRLSCRLFAAATALVSVAACDAGGVSGEIRGMPPATTAYARIVLLDDSVVTRAVGHACAVYAESLRTVPKKVASVLVAMRKEMGDEVMAMCKRENGSGVEGILACHRPLTETYAQIALSERPDHQVPEGWREGVKAIKEKRARREQAVRDEAMGRFSTVRDSILLSALRVPPGQAVASDGRFEIGSANSGEPFIVVTSPAGLELARIPPGITTLAYDSSTFRGWRACRPSR